MQIDIEWFNDQFNVKIASERGREPFLTVKGCRIVSGTKGPFVSWPSTKNEKSGKWWSHVWASEQFADVVLSKAQASMPSQKAPQRSRAAASDDQDMDVPF
jgi:DNA-binding cell septation regulator SpoVG